MTETDIKHLRRLCEAETLLLLEHFGHSNYDEVTVKQRLKMPKSLSYTETSSVDQAEKPSRKSSFRKFPKAKKKKKTKTSSEKKSSSWSIWGSMKNAVGFGSKEEESEEDSDSETEINTNTEENLSYSINGETVYK